MEVNTDKVMNGCNYFESYLINNPVDVGYLPPLNLNLCACINAPRIMACLDYLWLKEIEALALFLPLIVAH